VIGIVQLALLHLKKGGNLLLRRISIVLTVLMLVVAILPITSVFAYTGGYFNGTSFNSGPDQLTTTETTTLITDNDEVTSYVVGASGSTTDTLWKSISPSTTVTHYQFKSSAPLNIYAVKSDGTATQVVSVQTNGVKTIFDATNVVKIYLTNTSTSTVTVYEFDIFVSDTTAPAVPTGLAVSTGNSELTINWSANTETDLAGYNLYRSTDDVTFTKINTSTLTGTSYVDTGLTNGTTYYYQLSALDTSNNESTKTASVSGVPDGTAPASPSGLNGSVGDSKATLNWSANTETDLSGYNVYYSTDNVAFSKLNTTIVTTTTYEVLNLSNGTTYYFAVTAVDNFNNESARSTSVSVVPQPLDTVAPSVVQDVYAEPGDESANITWSPNTETDLAGYNVYKSSDGGVTFTKVNTTLIIGTNFVVQGLINDSTYQFYVTAQDTSGNESGSSLTVSSTPSSQLLPFLKFGYSLSDVSDGITSWFGSLWLIVAFSVAIPLSFIISHRIKGLFTS
jgi:hypothetical protein